MVERGFTPVRVPRTITAPSHYINGHVPHEQAVSATTTARIAGRSTPYGYRLRS